MDKATLYRGQDGDWRWVRTASNGEVVAASTEGYVHRTDAERNYERVAGEDAPLLEPGSLET